MAKLNIVTALIPVLLFGCKTARLPTEKYSQFEYKRSVTYIDGTLKIELDNPLHCPLRIWINTADEGLKNKFQSLPITLLPVSDTTIILTGVNNFDHRLEFASRLGSTSKEIKNMEVDLPFPPKREYAIIQGNYSGFTHNTDWARYALDFGLKTKDTICSATDGYVVGVVNRYQFGGAGREWEPYVNFITVYEPLSGLFFQYVHLVKNGSLVKTGDRITRGQPIGLSGNTGQTTTLHLHFSCMIPVSSEEGLKSVPIQFTGGKKGVELKRGDRVKKVTPQREMDDWVNTPEGKYSPRPLLATPECDCLLNTHQYHFFPRSTVITRLKFPSFSSMVYLCRNSDKQYDIRRTGKKTSRLTGGEDSGRRIKQRIC